MDENNIQSVLDESFSDSFEEFDDDILDPDFTLHNNDVEPLARIFPLSENEEQEPVHEVHVVNSYY